MCCYFHCVFFITIIFLYFGEIFNWFAMTKKIKVMLLEHYFQWSCLFIFKLKQKCCKQVFLALKRNPHWCVYVVTLLSFWFALVVYWCPCTRFKVEIINVDDKAKPSKKKVKRIMNFLRSVKILGLFLSLGRNVIREGLKGCNLCAFLES